MSYFGRNIKKIRTAKKISQSAFADLFNLKRGSVGAYEEGRAEARIDTIIEIATYYKLSLEQLLCKELTFNEIYHIDEISQKFDQPNRFKNDVNRIPLVKFSQRKDFIKKQGDKSYLSGIQEIILPDVKPFSIAFDLKSSDSFANYLSFDDNDIIVTSKVDKTEIERYPNKEIFFIYENEESSFCILSKSASGITFKTLLGITAENVSVIYHPYLLISKRLYSKGLDINDLSRIESKIDKLLKIS